MNIEKLIDQSVIVPIHKIHANIFLLTTRESCTAQMFLEVNCFHFFKQQKSIGHSVIISPREADNSSISEQFGFTRVNINAKRERVLLLEAWLKVAHS